MTETMACLKAFSPKKHASRLVGAECGFPSKKFGDDMKGFVDLPRRWVADPLVDKGGYEQALGRAIRNEVAIRAAPAERIEHVMFTISGNAAPT